jgi:hypothetical protein
MNSIRLYFFFAILVACLTRDVTAQDMRVYTQIRMKFEEGNSQPTQKTADLQPIVRSVMIFHAGKVYDYIEPAQEITVFEPALKRYTVINKQRQVRSELSQEQILHFLDLAKGEAQKHLLHEDVESNSKSLELLKFQLHPAFTVAFDAKKLQLSLDSSNFHYLVTGIAPSTPDAVENYLRVADWTAQLNSVLHPNSLLPGPRMVLNQELRQRKLVPSSVELKVDADPAIHLFAQHEWTWNLKDTDRQMIYDWEKLLQDPSYRNLPFRQFQQDVLKAEMARRR